MLLIRKEFEFSKVDKERKEFKRYKLKYISGVTHYNWARGGELYAHHDHIQVDNKYSLSQTKSIICQKIQGEGGGVAQGGDVDWLRAPAQ